jgi:ABC-type Fe3+/spermidine/putrescine transport system ATPase subunit
MNGGHVEQIGKPTEVYDYPSSHFVNNFVGSTSQIRAKVEEVSPAGSVLRISTGESVRLSREISFGAGSPIVVTARPERLTIVEASSDVTLVGKLLMSTPLGPNVIHSLQLSDGTEIKVVEPRDRRKTALEVSSTHLIELDVANLHFFPQP